MGTQRGESGAGVIGRDFVAIGGGDANPTAQSGELRVPSGARIMVRKSDDSADILAGTITEAGFLPAGGVTQQFVRLGLGTAPLTTSAVDPLNITGIVMHFDPAIAPAGALSASFKDRTNTVTCTPSGNPVKESSAGLLATPGIKLLAANSQYFTLTGMSAGASDYIVSMVVSPTVLGGGGLARLLDVQTGRWLVDLENAGVLDWFDTTDGFITPSGSPAPVAGPQLITFDLRNGAGAGKVFRNGVQLGTGNWTSTALGGTMTLGAQFNAAAGFCTATLGDVVVVTAPSDTKRNQIEAYLSRKYRLDRPQIFCIGDSYTAGIGAPAGKDWPTQLQTLLGGPTAALVFNRGVSGSTVTTRAGSTAAWDSAAQVALTKPLVGTLTTLSPTIVVLWPSGNDWYYVNGVESDTESKFRALCLQYLNQGAQVIVLTPPPRSTVAAETHAAWEADRQTFCTFLRNNYSQFAHKLVDIAADPRLGPDGSQSGNYAAADGVHLNDAGYQIVASLVALAITS